MTNNNTVVKNVTVGAPINTLKYSAEATIIVDTGNRNHYEFLRFDSSEGQYTHVGLSSALDSSVSTIRGYFNSGGDMSYDSATGTFSIDVEAIYSKSNFDSDFNFALDSNALHGLGIKYDSDTNRLALDSAEMLTYYTPVFRSVLVSGTGVSYDSSSGVISIGQSVAITDSVTFDGLMVTGNATIAGDLTVNGNLIVDSDLNVAGNFSSLGIDDNATSVAMTIDSSGMIGINTILPDGTFHVHTATSGSVTAGSSADDLIVENSTDAGITILAPDASYQKLAFGSPSNSEFAYLQGWYNSGAPILRYNVKDATGSHAWMINSSVKMTLDASGRMGLGTLLPTAKLDIDGISAHAGDSASLSTTTQTSIATFATATFSGGKFVIAAVDKTNSYGHMTELLIVHNGTTAYSTEYATIVTDSSLATFDVDISGANVRLLATSSTTNHTVYKVSENMLTT